MLLTAAQTSKTMMHIEVKADFLHREFMITATHKSTIFAGSSILDNLPVIALASLLAETVIESNVPLRKHIGE